MSMVVSVSSIQIMGYEVFEVVLKNGHYVLDHVGNLLLYIFLLMIHFFKAFENFKMQRMLMSCEY